MEGRVSEREAEYQIPLQDDVVSTDRLMTVTQASAWASREIGRTVTSSNITYLVKYGRIPAIGGNNGLMVRLSDLEKYYRSRTRSKGFVRLRGVQFQAHQACVRITRISVHVRLL